METYEFEWNWSEETIDQDFMPTGKFEDRVTNFTVIFEDNEIFDYDTDGDEITEEEIDKALEYAFENFDHYDEDWEYENQRDLIEDCYYN